MMSLSTEAIRSTFMPLPVPDPNLCLDAQKAGSEGPQKEFFLERFS